MSKPKPAAVLMFTIFLSILIAGWGIFFNRATIIVESTEIPFTVQLGNNFENCTSSPCAVKVKPKSYLVALKKNGFTTTNEDITLERGEKITLQYAPLKIPEMKDLEDRPDEFEEAYFDINNDGNQQMWLRTLDQGDIVITTFKNPLVSPQAAVNTDFSRALVWDDNREFWKVNIGLKSKEAYKFESSSLTNNIEFISPEFALISTPTEVSLLDITSDEEFTFPVDSEKHALNIDGEKILVVSKYDLDGFTPRDREVNFFELLRETGDGILEKSQRQDYKLFYFLKSKGQYVELTDLEGLNFRLYNTRVGNRLQPILSASGEWFELTFDSRQ